ncbi:MAG: SpoIIE family protein phosphatase [Bacteroidales bacterium]|nr:SpoIIE family protein phosphatase [Bacteroidales bacterium]
MIRVYLLFILLSVLRITWSQTYSPVDRFSVESGLSHSHITCLFIDSRGFLWIGTPDGLNRYDGYSFIKYQTRIGDQTSITNDYILDITEDADGNLWIATATGVSKFDITGNSFQSFTLKRSIDEDGIPVVITDIEIDTINNSVYLLGNGLIAQMDLSTYAVKRFPVERFYKLSQRNEFNAVKYDNYTNSILFITKRQIIEFNISNDSASIRFDIDKFTGNNMELVKDVACGYNGSLGILTTEYLISLSGNDSGENNHFKQKLATDSGIKLIYDGLTKCYHVIQTSSIYVYNAINLKQINTFNFTLPKEYQPNISTYCRSRSGVLWVGTFQGLYKFNLHKNSFKTIVPAAYTKSNKPVRISDAILDENRMIWAGERTGELTILKFETGSSMMVPFKQINLNTRINKINKSFRGDIFIATGNGVILYSYNRNSLNYSSNTKKYLTGEEIYAVYPEKNDTVWIAGESGFYLFRPEENEIELLKGSADIYSGNRVIEIQGTSKHIFLVYNNSIVEIDRQSLETRFINAQRDGKILTFIHTVLPVNEKELLVGTSNGVFSYRPLIGELSLLDLGLKRSNYHIHALHIDPKGTLWVSTNKGLLSVDKSKYGIKQFDKNDGLALQVFADRLVSSDRSGNILFGGIDRLIVFNPDSLIKNNVAPNIEFTQVVLNGKNRKLTINLVGVDTLEIEPDIKYFRINFSALDFWAPEKNNYKYSLVRLKRDRYWNSLDNQNYILLSGLRAGYYILEIKGANNEGVWNHNSRKLIIHVYAPFWQSHLAFVIYSILFILLFYLSVYFRTKHLHKQNREYREREQISKKIEQQKEELSVKNKNITDSINYAKRIQMALMPSQKLFKKLFPDSFILHLPKDIVSGDFYWVNEVDERKYFAAVDCTGHGVPGAFMSIIGFELFRRITETEKKKQPAEILNSLNREFELIFRDVENITLRDGMDVAFCAIDKKMKVLEFAGAFNPLYLVRDNKITEIKGDRFSVGLNTDSENDQELMFQDHVIPLDDGDIIYIFTDGFADQFGGPDEKKYKYRRFRHLLLALHELPMERQVEFLRRSILDWKGDMDQVDDILVIGVRVSNDDKIK